MKTYRKREVSYTRTIVDETFCDLCKSKIKKDRGYDVNEVTIELEEGSHYPEGKFTETSSVDMCPDCFKGKLVPWLESCGAEITVTESDC